VDRQKSLRDILQADEGKCLAVFIHHLQNVRLLICYTCIVPYWTSCYAAIHNFRASV